MAGALEAMKIAAVGRAVLGLLGLLLSRFREGRRWRLRTLLASVLLWPAALACVFLPSQEAIAEPPQHRAFSVTWQLVNSAEDLSDVAIVDSKTAWAVGANGVILATRDSGGTWERQKSGTENALWGVHFADGQTGWAVGGNGTILATRDGGAIWQPQKSGTENSLNCVHFIGAKTGWAVGANGTILATHDGGATWQQQKSGTTSILVGVYFVDAQTGWAVGPNGTILATHDGGATWEQQGSSSQAIFNRVYFADAQNGWLVGWTGILATRNGGATWEPQKTVSNLLNLTIFTGVHFADAQTGWVVGPSGTIMTTRDGGSTWHPQKSGISNNILLNRVHFVDTQTGWVVGANGTILATRDGGVTWEQQTKGADNSLNGVHLANAQTGWIVGANGTILATRDGGATWKSQQSGTGEMLARSDFADPQTGWVVGANGTILATRDGGATWERQKSGTNQLLYGVHFADARTGWAVGDNGTILATHDGGANWAAQKSGTKDLLSRVYFVDAQTGWIVGNNGTILSTHNGGATWDPQKSGTANNVLGVHFADAQTGWAVGARGTILSTRDGGATWEPQKSGTGYDLTTVDFANLQTGWAIGANGTILATRNGGAVWDPQKSGTANVLYNLHFADAQTGWAVGLNGTMVRATNPVYAPWIENWRAKSMEGGTVKVSLAVGKDSGVTVDQVRVEAHVGKLQWNAVGEPLHSPGADGLWHTAWKPAEYMIEKGSQIEYRVEIDDGGPPLAPYDLGTHTYAPTEAWWTRIWRDNRGEALTILAALTAFSVYLAGFGAIFWFAPARLAVIGASSMPDDLPKPAGNFGWVVGIVRRLLETLVLPWLIRRPRVRFAWTRRYAGGEARLDELNNTARASFLRAPDVLDAWIELRVDRIRASLDQLDLFRQRRVYVTLPLRIGERGTGRLLDRPDLEQARAWFARSRAVVAIVGEGGSGKSTLACALARWAMADDPAERLLPHRTLPVFIIDETTDLVDATTRTLRRMLGDQELPPDLIRGLLESQRLLLIVDALSERDEATRRHVQQLFDRSDAPVNALVITARRAPDLGPVERTTLYTEPITARLLIPFIFEYLNRSNLATLFAERQQVQLGERVLALAEAGGSATSVTPLLVQLFIDSAIERARDGGSFEDMPDAVPEVFIDYLRRVHPQSAASTVSEEKMIRAARVLAVVSLGQNQIPTDFRPDDARAALTARSFAADEADTFISQLIANGVVEQRHFGGLPLLRFNLDPVAEYLAAIDHIDQLRADRGGWSGFMAQLQQTDGYPTRIEGLLRAVSTCYRAYRPHFRLPDLVFPWDAQSGPVVRHDEREPVAGSSDRT